MKYAIYTGIVSRKADAGENSSGYNMERDSISLHEGDVYQDDDAIVRDRPEFFTDTEPNSQVAGAFPMEGTMRNSDLTKGDVVEEKRWEGHRPPGFEKSDEERSPTAADELRQEGEPERDADAGQERRSSSPKVERATRAPGERRTVVSKPKGS
jgi:hypothetical protein